MDVDVLAPVRAAAALSLLVVTAVAQVPGVPQPRVLQQGQPPQPTPAQVPVPQDPFAPQNIPQQGATEVPRYRPGFQGLESVYPTYPGYPTYPRGLGPQVRTSRPAPGEAIPEWKPGPQPSFDLRGWPVWMRQALTEKDRIVTPERAVLARGSDRVWFLAPDDNAFVPLSYWDKLRIVDPGARVEVRNKGDFLIAMHDGARIRSAGPTRLGVLRLSKELGEVDVDAFTRLWVDAKTRPLRLTLPDASVVDATDAGLYLEREGGRAELINHGPQPVTRRSRSGKVVIGPGRRVELLVERPRGDYQPAGLRLQGGVRIERDGRVLVAHGDGPGGAVVWAGTRIDLPPGSVVRLDPLAGKEFPEKQE